MEAPEAAVVGFIEMLALVVNVRSGTLPAAVEVPEASTV
jgi:hypothetical protein